MNWFNLKMSKYGAIMLVALCTACATAPVVDTNVTINFPTDQIITSVAQADQILDAVTLSRAQIKWRYRQKEQICFDKFFMNSCLLNAKTERRVDLSRVKKSEVAANFFKRKSAVEDIDRNLVEKNAANPLPDPNPGPSQKRDDDADPGEHNVKPVNRSE